jgi:hypothetical protein
MRDADDEKSKASRWKLMEDNLATVLAEIRTQPDVGKLFPPELQSLPEEIEMLQGWIEEAREYGIAYEALVCLLESYPFQLSGRAAIKLLEVGLLMRLKTERPEDAAFDSR